MKRVTLIIDDDCSDVISITAIATRGNVTNVNTSARRINDGDFIYIPETAKAMEEKNDENH